MFVPAQHTYSVQFLQNYDPTRTLTLRNRLAASMRRRWRALNSEVHEAIVDDDIFGLQARALAREQAAQTLVVPPQMFGHLPPAQQVTSFIQWLEDREADLIFETPLVPGIQGAGRSGSMWIDTYTAAAYEQGIKRARSEMRRAGYAVPSIDDSGGIVAVLSRQFHQDELGVRTVSLVADMRNAVTATNGLVSQATGPALMRELSAVELAERNAKILLGNLPDVTIPDINQRFMAGMHRSVQIGRTGMVKAHHMAMMQEYQNWGVEGFEIMAEWVTAGDEKVCVECQKMEANNPYTIEEIITLIPLHPNCVAGDSAIIAPDMKNIMKSSYSGPIIKITLSNGTDLTVTPNHMLFSEDGFIMARFLSDGDNLVQSADLERVIFSNPNYDRDYFRIDNIIKSFSESGSSPASRVPVSAEDFHGDGVFCEENIDIVWTDSLLENGLNSGLIKLFSDKDFTPGSILDAFTGCRTFASFLERRFSTLGGGIGLSREFLAFFRGCFLHALKHGGTPTAGGDTVFFKNSDYDIASKPHFFTDFFNRHPAIKGGDDDFGVNVDSVVAYILSERKAALNEPAFNSFALSNSGIPGDGTEGFSGHIPFVKIVDVDVSHVDSFPVYDVSTLSTLYNVNGVMSSNCRCIALPVKKK